MNRQKSSENIVLGIADSFVGSAAVLIDGRLVAAVSEERLTRVKMAYGWPRHAIDVVLRIAGVAPHEVTHVAVASTTAVWRPEAGPIPGYFEVDWGFSKNLTLALGALGAPIFGRSALALEAYRRLKKLATRKRLREIPRVLREVHGVTAPVSFLDHHLCHAAGAYYYGGEPNAVVVTLDGGGDGLSGSVYLGRDGQLERKAAIQSYDSIGNWYSYVTHLLGFKAHRHEGKVTGLAAYGSPEYAGLFRRCIRHGDGTLENRARAFHRSAIAKLRRLLPADASREDVAASIQLVLEEACTALVSTWLDRLGRPAHVRLAGGVFANVKLNQRIHELPGVKSVFIFPGMGDEGLAVGAAVQYVAEQASQRGKREELVTVLPDVYLGPEFSDADIRRALESAELPYTRPSDLADAVADLVTQRKVVALFQGRMEFGPRALGNRSVLCHAGDPSVNDWLNDRLKRTEFMPFAPVTLEEESARCYIGLEGAEYAARFMTITCDCTPWLKDVCPAVVHVDGTARPQLVGKDENPFYRRILEAYRARTGFSTMINTSFNMHEEPIVCTPEDAIRAFVRGHLDALAIGGYLALAASPVALRAESLEAHIARKGR